MSNHNRQLTIAHVNFKKNKEMQLFALILKAYYLIKKQIINF